MRLINQKRGQEEIVGFVVIVVLVLVVLMILMGLFAFKDNKSEIRNSGEVFQFLDSSMQFTSDCAIKTEYKYIDLKKLIKECEKGNDCLDGRNSCDALEESYGKLINASWVFDEAGVKKGYELNIFKDDNSGQLKDILLMNSGNCSGGWLGSEYFMIGFDGNIITELKICS